MVGPSTCRYPEPLPGVPEDSTFSTTCALLNEGALPDRVVPNATLFCAICNHLSHIYFDSCVVSIDTPFPFVLVVSSKALLSFATSSAIAALRDSCRCASDKVYDEFESKCQKLHCSLTRRLENGSCRPFFEKSEGVAYELTVRLTPTETEGVLEVPDTEILLDIAPSLHRELIRLTGLRMPQIDLFQMTVKTEQSQDRSLNAVLLIHSVDLKVKMITRTPYIVEELDDLLLLASRSAWNVNIGEKKLFRAAPIYSKTVDMDSLYSQYGFSPVPVLSSEGPYSYYIVDITSDLESIEGFPVSTDSYQPVQDSLNCSKVAFTLATDTSPQQTAGTNTRNPFQAPDAEGQSKKNAQTSEQTSSSIVQSVDETTGEVILSLDRDKGEVQHHPSGRRISFQYVEQREDGLVLVCAEQLYDTLTASTTHRPDPLVLEKFFSSHMIYASVACQSLSVVSLFVVLVTYCLFPELRTLPGKNTMGMVTSLFVAMLLFEVGVARVELPAVCTVLGVVIHFCLLSAFTWMVICSAYMFHVFKRVRASRHRQSEHDKSLFAKHVVLSLTLPALIVTPTLVGNWVAHRDDCVLDLGYGQGICYLSNTWSLALASVLPICVAVVTNLGFFIATLRAIRTLSAETLIATQRQRRQLTVYVRMSTLTGINWLAGLITAVIDSFVVWYIFIVLCGLQGVYVFVAFVCNKRVLALYRALLCCSVGGEKTKEKSRRDGTPVNTENTTFSNGQDYTRAAQPSSIDVD
ncbi:hypothetical protein V1264_010390 [Littorina saxatilis]|uniref:G-protein coupled receptors family 2 profile 2 domain-containing protein n=1 Tax=Littorina saxatilis TaxID=31220 RepID=A0AAN9G077_9CAEN